MANVSEQKMTDSALIKIANEILDTGDALAGAEILSEIFQRNGKAVFHFRGQPKQLWPLWCRGLDAGEQKTCWFVQGVGCVPDEEFWEKFMIVERQIATASPRT